jgi:heme-degrading monooxygenase HmoA
VIRALLEMRVASGDEDVFVDAWKGVAKLAAAAPGNVRQALLRDESEPTRFVISSDWNSLADFRAFERSPAQDAATAPLRRLRLSASMSVFEVASAFEGPVEDADHGSDGSSHGRS